MIADFCDIKRYHTFSSGLVEALVLNSFYGLLFLSRPKISFQFEKWMRISSVLDWSRSENWANYPWTNGMRIGSENKECRTNESKNGKDCAFARNALQMQRNRNGDKTQNDITKYEVLLSGMMFNISSVQICNYGNAPNVWKFHCSIWLNKPVPILLLFSLLLLLLFLRFTVCNFRCVSSSLFLGPNLCTIGMGKKKLKTQWKKNQRGSNNEEKRRCIHIPRLY